MPAKTGRPIGTAGRETTVIFETDRLTVSAVEVGKSPSRIRIASLTVVGILAAGLAASTGRAAWVAAHSTVPVLVGQTVTAAAKVVQPLRLGLEVSTQRQDLQAAFGVILDQDPAPGRHLLKESVIRLTLSQGSGVVPDLRGIPVSTAAKRLEAEGLRLGGVSYTYDDGIAAGSVISQSESTGTHLAPNGPVDVLVSQGPPHAGLPTPASVLTPAPALMPLPAPNSADVPSPAPVPMTPAPVPSAPEHTHGNTLVPPARQHSHGNTPVPPAPEHTRGTESGTER